MIWDNFAAQIGLVREIVLFRELGRRVRRNRETEVIDFNDTSQESWQTCKSAWVAALLKRYFPPSRCQLSLVHLSSKSAAQICPILDQQWATTKILLESILSLTRGYSTIKAIDENYEDRQLSNSTELSKSYFGPPKAALEIGRTS